MNLTLPIKNNLYKYRLHMFFMNRLSIVSKIIVLNEFPMWIRLLHPKYLEYCRQISGKWVYRDKPDKLRLIALNLLDLICDGFTSEIKYRPTANDTNGPYAHLDPPICIYSCNENKDELEDRIKSSSLITNIYWLPNSSSESD